MTVLGQCCGDLPGHRKVIFNDTQDKPTPLIAGAPLENDRDADSSEAVAEWSRVVPGEWFRTTLDGLRDPSRARLADVLCELRRRQRLSCIRQRDARGARRSAPSDSIRSEERREGKECRSRWLRYH